MRTIVEVLVQTASEGAGMRRRRAHTPLLRSGLTDDLIAPGNRNRTARRDGSVDRESYG